MKPTNAQSVPYQNGLPLKRQEQRTQPGAALNRATLANWIIYCTEHYFSPVYDYFHRQLLKRQYLMADKARVWVLKEPERNQETDSWMWLLLSGEDDLPPIILYHYTETRAKYNAESFLNERYSKAKNHSAEQRKVLRICLLSLLFD